MRLSPLALLLGLVVCVAGDDDDFPTQHVVKKRKTHPPPAPGAVLVELTEPRRQLRQLWHTHGRKLWQHNKDESIDEELYDAVDEALGQMPESDAAWEVQMDKDGTTAVAVTYKGRHVPLPNIEKIGAALTALKEKEGDQVYLSTHKGRVSSEAQLQSDLLSLSLEISSSDTPPPPSLSQLSADLETGAAAGSLAVGSAWAAKIAGSLGWKVISFAALTASKTILQSQWLPAVAVMLFAAVVILYDVSMVWCGGAWTAPWICTRYGAYASSFHYPDVYNEENTKHPKPLHLMPNEEEEQRKQKEEAKKLEVSGQVSWSDVAVTQTQYSWGNRH